MKKIVNGVEVESVRKGEKIFFFARKGQACWDTKAGEWVKVHKEFGFKFKAQIKKAFEL